MINGVDFYGNEILVQDQGELLEDAFSVKGDYFYLKKGDTVSIRYAIGEYVEVKQGTKVGYFPSGMIRLIQGQNWKEPKSKTPAI